MKYITILLIAGASIAQTLQAQHSPYIAGVDEYVPAPGQFVNTLPLYEEGDDAATMARKCSEAIAHNAGGLVTLGAWGGYITFHFDHPVVNLADQMDLYIGGNAIEGSSEAGIVMVSRDTNGNGMPDDAWYELSGSADSDSTNVTYGYQLTYTLTEALGDVPWCDNEGHEGVVERNAFHKQEYFPLWLSSPLTMTGTRLADNAHDTSGTGKYWVLDALRYGYVDNLPNKDTLANSFDIGWAVDPVTRMSVSLPSIDFVRVYTALNQSAGWLGETSTEVSGAKDLHPDAVAGIAEVTGPTPSTQAYDLWGRPLRDKANAGHRAKTLNIKDNKIIYFINQH